MNKWEEEIELVDNLGLLYPDVKDYWSEYDKTWDNYYKACWVYVLCVYQLNQRMAQLEKFLKYYLCDYWEEYKNHFKIK